MWKQSLLLLLLLINHLHASSLSFEINEEELDKFLQELADDVLYEQPLFEVSPRSIKEPIRCMSAFKEAETSEAEIQEMPVESKPVANNPNPSEVSRSSPVADTPKSVLKSEPKSEPKPAPVQASTMPSLRPPPLPSLTSLDCPVDTASIRAWFLYKYRLASREFDAQTVDYSRLRITNWPPEVPFIRGGWGYLHLLVLKQALANNQINFLLTEPGIDLAANAELEERLKRASGAQPGEAVNWDIVLPFIKSDFLTCTEAGQWNAQDRMHLESILRRMSHHLKFIDEMATKKRRIDGGTAGVAYY